MTTNAAVLREIEAHREDIERFIAAIMREHGAACEAQGNPCEWAIGAFEGILAEHARALCAIMERYHVRTKEMA